MPAHCPPLSPADGFLCCDGASVPASNLQNPLIKARRRPFTGSPTGDAFMDNIACKKISARNVIFLRLSVREAAVPPYRTRI